MPVYEFACSSNQCPTYEVWRSISDRDTSTECPECGSQGQRLFNSPMMLTGGLRLKTERKEPELVTKKKREPSTKPRLQESTTRPWMLNRGC